MSRKRRDFSISAPPGEIAPAGPAMGADGRAMHEGAAPAPAPGRPARGGKDAAAAPAREAPRAEGPLGEGPLGETPRRRSPMAAAVHETAMASQARAEQAAAIRAENDALAAELVRLKRAGLVTDLIPLDQIHARRLVRDRAAGPDPELAELIASIRAVGLSNPIRVAPVATAPGVGSMAGAGSMAGGAAGGMADAATGQGGYELIEGWRRVSAYRALYEETGAEAWARIPAAMVPQGKTLAELYRRMVDENLVRRGISFAEMAELARRYAADPQTEAEDVDAAVTALYQSAGYQKRSYIRAFAELLDWLDKHLEHPAAIPRKLGLDLRRRIDAAPGLSAQIGQALRAAGPRSEAEELAILRRFAEEGGAAAGPPAPRDLPRGEAAAPGRTGAARTSLRLDTGAGLVRVTAGQGRLEIRTDRDFAETDRRRLEAGLRALLAELDRPDDV
ncbi:MAG: replication protein [Pseudomonadota bacterium]